MKFDDLSSEDNEEPEEISVAELLQTDLTKLAEGQSLTLFESDFPESIVWREGGEIVVEITEHIYTKYWWHKYHAAVFAEAMKRAVLRLSGEGWPLSHPDIESDDDVHLFIRWQLRLPLDTAPKTLVDATRAVFDGVWERANSILEDSDSVLILGKDTVDGLDRLKKIEEIVQKLGYHTYLVKE